MNSVLTFLGPHLCELFEHGLLLTEGCEGDASHHPDRHLQLQQQQQQQAHSQGLHSDQGLLWQGESGLLEHSALCSVESVLHYIFLVCSNILFCILQGAERKLRDEEKKQLRKRSKG